MASAFVAMDKAFEHWNPPALVFTCTWLLASLSYSVLDITQPTWYQKLCCVDENVYKPMTGKVWWKLFKNNVINLMMSYIVGLSLFTLRFLVSGCSLSIPYLLQFAGCYVGRSLVLL